jgi:hypothetical protein
MNEFPENDALWKVLGRASSAKASPYFVRKVLREVRTVRQGPSPLALWLRWLTPLGAAAALTLAVVTWESRRQEDADFNAYFDTAADLESLVVFEESIAWADLN